MKCGQGVTFNGINCRPTGGDEKLLPRGQRGGILARLNLKVNGVSGEVQDAKDSGFPPLTIDDALPFFE